jgi:NADH-quinone oxidoreductase subunit G
MPKVKVNGIEVEVDKGTTLLRAAAHAGFEVPHFCYHPALSAPANCRMCLVEVEGAPKLMPGCYNAVSDNMIIHTESARVKAARKSVLEFILINHPVDCPICDKAGECKLQDYYFAYDAQESRMRAEKQHKVKVYPIGPNIVYDGERCILCTRCIRFCEEISGTAELTLVERGDKIEVRTFPGQELDNPYALCTVDICPVGALTSRDFRFKCRVWLLTSTESVCTGCAKGCNIHLDHFRNEIQRYRPRYNPAVNDYWMCDTGRMSYKEVHADRLLRATRNGAAATLHAAASSLADKLSEVALAHGNDAIGFVVSPQASCESLYMAKLFARDVLKTTKLYLGGKPDGDSDALLIRADKNPNRKGVEQVFGSLEGFGSADALLKDLGAGKLKALYMMGSELALTPDKVEEVADLAGKLDLFVLQAPFAGALAAHAHLALPATTHAEEDGTFVNEDGIEQDYFEAFAPHGESQPHWKLFNRVANACGVKPPVSFLAQIQDKMFEDAPKPPPAADAAQAEAGAE